MAILYALVARGTVVLAEHSAAATNAGAVARQVLERLPDGGADSHVSYTQDRYVFHAKRTDGITALCMADDAAGSKPAPPSSVAPCLSPCIDRARGRFELELGSARGVGLWGHVVGRHRRRRSGGSNSGGLSSRGLGQSGVVY
jgi:hypothetical protein